MKAALIIVAFVIAELGLVWSILSFVFQRLWRKLADEFPPRPVTDPSIYRAYQSFAINAMNLGGCVHVTLDDECLHLRPAKMLRWMGLKEISIPWDSMEIDSEAIPERKRQLLPDTVLVRIGENKLVGPRWCFEIILQNT